MDEYVVAAEQAQREQGPTDAETDAVAVWRGRQALLNGLADIARENVERGGDTSPEAYLAELARLEEESRVAPLRQDPTDKLIAEYTANRVAEAARKSK